MQNLRAINFAYTLNECEEVISLGGPINDELREIFNQPQDEREKLLSEINNNKA